MKAVVYTRKGGTEVLRIVEREVPEPGPGEVRVRMAVSGVNPTDCKTRSGVVGGTSMPFAEVVPNQDGSGVIDKVGTGVAQGRVGQRVWVWEAAWQRADGCERGSPGQVAPAIGNPPPAGASGARFRDVRP